MIFNQQVGGGSAGTSAVTERITSNGTYTYNNPVTVIVSVRGAEGEPTPYSVTIGEEVLGQGILPEIVSISDEYGLMADYSGEFFENSVVPMLGEDDLFIDYQFFAEDSDGGHTPIEVLDGSHAAFLMPASDVTIRLSYS